MSHARFANVRVPVFAMRLITTSLSLRIFQFLLAQPQGWFYVVILIVWTLCRYYYDKNIMTKVHGKRYAYKFDFQGLAAATQPAASDPAYKYQSDLFMSSYHHSAKLSSFMAPHAAMPTSTGNYNIKPERSSELMNTKVLRKRFLKYFQN